MVIDSSAMMAILKGEPEERAFANLLSAQPLRHMSPVNWFEVALNVEKYESIRLTVWEQLAAHLNLIIVPVDETQMRLAHSAWRKYGKGRNRARLNMGDCFAYALAKHLDEPLLYKGSDFVHTDIASAVP
jgi:ribonuclease VapC